MEDVVNFLNLAWEWVISPLMTLIEASVSELTGMPTSLVASISQVIFIVVVCTFVWNSVSTDLKEKITPDPTGLGKVAFVVIGVIGWVSINFVYGTYGLASFLWGGNLPAPIRTIISIMPSTIQWMYMINPPVDGKSKQIEKTVIIIDFIGTVFGLAISLGTPPNEFFTLIFNNPGEFLTIIILGFIGNLYIERAIFDVVTGKRASKPATAKTAKAKTK